MSRLQTTNQLYKNKYSIVFYDKSDEIYLCQFNNVVEILKWLNKDITRNNKITVSNHIIRALKSDTHFIRFENKDIMRVYLIDILEES